MGLLLITRFTLQEALRRKLFLAMLILGLLLLWLFAFSLQKSVEGLTAAHPATSSINILLLSVALTLPAMWIVFMLSSILTILFTIGMISNEVDAGTLVLIVPKPLRRGEIVVGKWLGHALIVCLYTTLLFLAFAGAIDWQTGYLPDQLWPALGILLLSMLTLLGLTTLGSALFPTAVNGAIALVLFLAAPIMSIVEAVQIDTPSRALQNIATSIDLILPANAFWHTTAFYLTPSEAFLLVQGLSDRSASNPIPFMSPQPLAPAMLIWGVLYILILPALAALHFSRRDL
ncbi:MAG: ABC transporter permease subunit [Ktedonobacteraceae bacterium]|nr:ABC transporter permease subunit [Ktedonobacteraceae bacterium]